MAKKKKVEIDAMVSVESEALTKLPCGTLYICGTPIGNLDDVTLRLIKTLKAVDLVAAEDTRHSLKLLNHLEIQKSLVSYHEHNRLKAGPKLIEKLLAGQNIALLSDAGMPGISDPGEDLVKLAIEANIEMVCVDGPVAAIHALVLSGLPTRRFAFEGFVDRNSKVRKKQFESLRYDSRTLIFYEAPHRLKDFLKDAFEVLGAREAAVCKELTKRFENFQRGTLEQLGQYFELNEPRGEFVIILSGFEGEAPTIENPLDQLSIAEELLLLMEQGMGKKEATAVVAKRRELPKKEVYQVSIDL
jgi:16S rRNA (cytidine1402-2'-O)-methyltransferase